MNTDKDDGAMSPGELLFDTAKRKGFFNWNDRRGEWRDFYILALDIEMDDLDVGDVLCGRPLINDDAAKLAAWSSTDEEMWNRVNNEYKRWLEGQAR